MGVSPMVVGSAIPVAVGVGTLGVSSDEVGVAVKVGLGSVTVDTLVSEIVVFVAGDPVGVVEMISGEDSRSGSSVLVRIIAVGTVTEILSERSRKTPQATADVTVNNPMKAVVNQYRWIMLHSFQIGSSGLAYGLLSENS